MSKKRRVIYFVMLIALGLFCYFSLIRERIVEKVPLTDTVETIPAAENTVPNKEKELDSTKIEKQEVTPQTPRATESEKIQRPASVSISHNDPVNLEEQSYSIHNQKKEIPLTSGVSLQPGKSVNIKVSGDDEIIRIQRDKVYHPGGYNVLLEKKY